VAINLPDSFLKAVDNQLPSLIPTGTLVPNVFPTIDAPYRLAIVGEAPGDNETKQRHPFVGASGHFLNQLLAAHGIDRRACFVGNICNYQPPENKLSYFKWNGPEITESLDRLTNDIRTFNPNLILLLGKYALRAACGEFRSITAWRGSLLQSNYDSPFAGRKCLPSIHPAGVLRKYDWSPLLRLDLSKSRIEATSPALDLPKRNLLVGCSYSTIIRALGDIVERARQQGPPVWVSFDLEGYWNRVTRFSFATSPTEGFVVPITSGEFDSHWSLDEELGIWVAVSRILTDPLIPKVLQNSLYDRFVLAYQYKILISNVAWDTMLGHWELFCELDKNLGLQASIYTREPYWKEEREDEDLSTRELYCCKDSAVTEEIRQVQSARLAEHPKSLEHFKFNLNLLDPLLFMSLRGINYDSVGAASARKEVLHKLWGLKHQLNLASGRMYLGSKEDLLRLARSAVCKKREAPYVMVFGQLPGAALKGKMESAVRLAEMDKEGRFEGEFSLETLGEIEYLLDIELNVDSSKQMVDWLYVQPNGKRFERQYNETESGAKVLTSDVSALLTIYRKTQDQVCKLILQIRSLLYTANILDTKVDPDGRIRCGYNVVGSDTGRLACYKSPTGSGYNLQTVTKKYRWTLRADPGMHFFQCDLAGADGWTVAAHCKRLGDPTMLDDYLFGLKPAKIVAQMYLTMENEKARFEANSQREMSDKEMDRMMHEVARYINSLSRADLAHLGKQVDPDGWLYFASKRVQHGTNYGAQEDTVSNIILKDSYKFLGDPIYVPPRTCGRLRALYLSRYIGVERWHYWVENQLLTHGRLIAASGSARRFFGRIKDGTGINQETLRNALAHEPQHNTTYVTDLGVLKLWNDPKNRDYGRRYGLIVEPLHQVHDALNGQFPISETDYCLERIRYAMHNPITIADQLITIPFEGAYGTSWGDLKAGKI